MITKDLNKWTKYKCKYCKVVFEGYKKIPRQYCSASCRSKDGNFGQNNKHDNWQGDRVSYNALHKWVNRHYGRCLNCEYCGIEGHQGKRIWSIEWANKSGKYKRNRTDWEGLCRKCHSNKDKVYRKSPHKKTLYVGKQTIFKK